MLIALLPRRSRTRLPLALFMKLHITQAGGKRKIDEQDEQDERDISQVIERLQIKMLAAIKKIGHTR